MFPTWDSLLPLSVSCVYSPGIWSGQPLRVYWSTWLSTGSCQVAFCSWDTVTGKDCIWPTVIPCRQTDSSDLVSLTGNLDSPSAFVFSCALLIKMSYWYADSIKAQHWSLAAARVGIPFFGPKMVVRGLWSVHRMNLCPYKYWWNTWWQR